MQILKVSRFLIVLLNLLLSSSCIERQFDDEALLGEYLKDPDNGYLHTKTINGVAYSLLYKPTDLLVKLELEDSYTPEDVVRFRKKYKDHLYFTLSMVRGNQELLNSVAGSKQAFGAMVNTLAFGMEEKVHLYTEKRDTIPMIDYVYPRMYGMTNNTSVLLVYAKEKLNDAKQITLVVEDLGFGTGEVKFSQEIDLINNQPQLKL